MRRNPQGAREAFPEAGITFDRFHVQRLMNRAVDEVRQERKERPDLNRTRYLWLKRRGKLTVRQRERLDELLDPTGRSLKTAFAYRIKLGFEAFRDLPPRLAEVYLDKWCSWAAGSGLQPVIDAAKTIRKHWDGILLVPLKDQQRHDRGHQLARPGRQGQGPRLPDHRELHHHRLSRVRQTQLQTTHLKQRRTQRLQVGVSFEYSPFV